MVTSTTSLTHCPTCKKPTTWTQENPYRPFCSKRCQLIDFGEWMKEVYKIPGESASEDRRQMTEDSN
jgi:endogenous inhibitor of DNA gyrase (YacG/DUF329 family)